MERRKQSGRIGRLTADEIEKVRDVHRRWNAVRYERMRVQADLGLRTDMFCRIGRGVVGKKPRSA